MSTTVHRTEPWQFDRVIVGIEHCEAREFVREVFDHHRGAKRVFNADAFLAGYLLTPMLGLPLHQTKVAEVVRGWSNSQRREVGLPAHVEISSKSVNDALRRLMEACRSPRHPEWDERAVAQALRDATLWCHLLDAPAGSDARYIYTIGIDARMGWRSGEFEEVIFFCGFDLHVITEVPSAPGRGPVVHVSRAMNLSPAGANKGVIGLPGVQALGDSIGKARHLTADRAYNSRLERCFPQLWEAVSESGYSVMDARGRHLNMV
ncbi:hypothetical protein [Rhodococcus sp. LB1]|uniref:hypothetical protein n=1 Tax=Rhodococcus sp. LB1 TaxID=1807499 RepID=UPI001E5C4F0A|nr:hypothetical protein [Rhodococcus sp. LB1]